MKRKISRLENREKLLEKEETFRTFKTQVFEHRDKLVEFVHKKNRDGELILGYGASTKGNVILQFCNFTSENIPFIGEINPDKFGSFTPGTLIPIISEEEVRQMGPAYLMVLPGISGIIYRQGKRLPEIGEKAAYSRCPEWKSFE